MLSLGLLMPSAGRGSAQTIRFGVFELNTQTRELSKRGSKLRLTDQAYQLLTVLLEHPGQVVGRELFQERSGRKAPLSILKALSTKR